MINTIKLTVIAIAYKTKKKYKLKIHQLTKERLKNIESYGIKTSQT